MEEEEASDSSGDIPPNPEDIKKMAPYDQRKDPNYKPPPPPETTKKLNINYEELEDSGSEGSGELNREDPNHLASIIEEDEEATEYQRSRSRSKSPSGSPIHYGRKIRRDEKRRSIGKFCISNSNRT